MTDSRTPPDPVEEWLTSHHRRLVEDLAVTLDLVAGAEEASQPRHYTALSTDLASQLDLTTGLARILGPAPPGREPDHSTTTPLPGDSATVLSWAAHLSAALRTLDPATRLQLRGFTQYQLLRLSVDLIMSPDSDLSAVDLTQVRSRDLAGALDSARAHDHRILDIFGVLDSARYRVVDLDRALSNALDHARAVDSARARTRVQALIRARDRVGPFTGALDTAFALVFALDHAFDRHIDRAVRSSVDLDYALDRAIDHAHTVNSARAVDSARTVNIDHDLDTVRALTLAHDLCRSLAFALAHAVARDFGKRHLNLVLDPDSMALEHHIEELAVSLADTADNFIDVDLRAVSLSGVALQGIRWSATTRWPPGWAERIDAMSVAISTGVFRIQPGHPDREFTRTP